MPVDSCGNEIEIEDKENPTPVEYVMLLEEMETRESMMEMYIRMLVFMVIVNTRVLYLQSTKTILRICC